MTTVLPSMIPSTHKLGAGHFDGDGCLYRSAPHLVPLDPIAAVLMPGAPVHYGVHVIELGEDGDCYGLAGHVTRRRALAAVMRTLRVDAGCDVRDYFFHVPSVRVDHRWVLQTRDGEDPIWTWTLGYDASSLPITVVYL